jgi:HD-GYP domain-containing protein (c-di-GMP phosphodiesterase class II)
MNLSDEEKRDIVLASILHDIGAFTGEERMRAKLALFDDSGCDQHAIMGYHLLRNFEPLMNAATMIRYHHEHYDKAMTEIPIGSYIVHLADRLSILFDEQQEILEQIPGIMANIDQWQNIFHPDTLAALHQVVKKEYFWIEACSFPINSVLPDRMRFLKKILDLDTLRDFAKLIAQIIDFRSRFTSTHSAGVAAVALELTTISEFSEKECRLMEIAGYLHDLGKLAIPDEILEKNGTFNHQEFNTMRKHTYYTYVVLNKIKGLEQVAMWAAYHHERLDGNGYPFHIKGKDFSKLARIMSVADIVTAITEDRPYRLGMDGEKAIKILFGMVKDGGIDKGVVEIVKDNFSRINDVRIKAQQNAALEYKQFQNLSAGGLRKKGVSYERRSKSSTRGRLRQGKRSR